MSDLHIAVAICPLLGFSCSWRVFSNRPLKHNQEGQGSRNNLEVGDSLTSGKGYESARTQAAVSD